LDGLLVGVGVEKPITSFLYDPINYLRFVRITPHFPDLRKAERGVLFKRFQQEPPTGSRAYCGSEEEEGSTEESKKEKNLWRRERSSKKGSQFCISMVLAVVGETSLISLDGMIG
jgi:hypothetical protein